MTKFALSPKERLPYLAEIERKAKSNEERLQGIMATHPTEDELFLISLIETAIIVGRKQTSKNARLVEAFKELLDADKLEWILDELQVEVCTADHYDY